MIEAQGLEKTYGSVRVLNGVHLFVKQGEVVSIAGASGAGKSTLLHVLGTLVPPDQGHFSINGKSPLGLSGKALAQFRNTSIGFVFQFHQLLPEFTALENVMLPGLIGGRNKKIVKDKAVQLLERLGVSHRATHKPGALSGGEQQRVAVARALINSPAVILADEPSGNLDSVHAAELHDLFFALRDEMGLTFLIVTHNEILAGRSDRKLILKDGILH